jgi:hypothetical protein
MMEDVNTADRSSIQIIQSMVYATAVTAGSVHTVFMAHQGSISIGFQMIRPLKRSL